MLLCFLARLSLNVIYNLFNVTAKEGIRRLHQLGSICGQTRVSLQFIFNMIINV